MKLAPCLFYIRDNP